MCNVTFFVLRITLREYIACKALDEIFCYRFKPADKQKTSEITRFRVFCRSGRIRPCGILLPTGIVGPNLYADGKEVYLCFEAFCSGKGSVMLVYSVHRKAFAVLERPSGNFAGARFSEDEETVTLVEDNGSSMQFVMDTLTRIPPERPEETPESMEKTTSDTENF